MLNVFWNFDTLCTNYCKNKSVALNTYYVIYSFIGTFYVTLEKPWIIPTLEDEIKRKGKKDNFWQFFWKKMASVWQAFWHSDNNFPECQIPLLWNLGCQTGYKWGKPGTLYDPFWVHFGSPGQSDLCHIYYFSRHQMVNKLINKVTNLADLAKLSHFSSWFGVRDLWLYLYLTSWLCGTWYYHSIRVLTN